MRTARCSPLESADFGGRGACSAQGLDAADLPPHSFFGCFVGEGFGDGDGEELYREYGTKADLHVWALGAMLGSKRAFCTVLHALLQSAFSFCTWSCQLIAASRLVRACTAQRQSDFWLCGQHTSSCNLLQVVDLAAVGVCSCLEEQLLQCSSIKQASYQMGKSQIKCRHSFGKDCCFTC